MFHNIKLNTTSIETMSSKELPLWGKKHYWLMLTDTNYCYHVYNTLQQY